MKLSISRFHHKLKLLNIKYPKLKLIALIIFVVIVVLCVALPLTLITPPNTSPYSTGNESNGKNDTNSLTITKSNETILNNIYFTFYGFDDNDNGMGTFATAVISDPTIHKIATEDLGTFERPSTFAGDEKYRLTVGGQKIYVPRLKKYYIMEDTCVECTRDRNKGKLRIDLYIGGNTKVEGKPLSDCEGSLTLDVLYSETVIINPNASHPVDTKPLFSNGTCYVPK
eukprot:NODE_656_length_4979_cov_1.014754.p2 type:complete len:227 gc:universal NODE_656_length_4979_cov_1.014754:1608-2288(+)